MAWDKGFNFRGSSGFVTDGTDETYVLADAYPTTRNGVTFGWEDTGVSAYDANAAVDRRLSGFNYWNSASKTFRVDLPSTGDYQIQLGLADTRGGSSYFGYAIQIKDTSSVVHSFSGVDLLNGNALDVAGNSYSYANWPANQAIQTETFSTTIFRAALSVPSDWATIAHLFLSQQAAGGGSVTVTPDAITSTIAVQSVSFVLDCAVTVNALTNTATLEAPTINTTANVVVLPDALVGTFALPASTLAFDMAVLPSPVIATFVMPNPTVLVNDDGSTTYEGKISISISIGI